MFVRSVRSPALPNFPTGTLLDYPPMRAWIRFDRRSQFSRAMAYSRGCRMRFYRLWWATSVEIWIMSAGAGHQIHTKHCQSAYLRRKGRLGQNYHEERCRARSNSARGRTSRHATGQLFRYGIRFVRFHPDLCVIIPHPACGDNGVEKFNAVATLSVAIVEADTIELSYTDNFISFEFAALNFRHPKKSL